MMNAIKIFSRNYVDGNATITATTGSNTAALVDQNRDTQWTSELSTDGDRQTLTFQFNNADGTAIERTFDRIILLNTNFLDYTVEYYNGSSWVEIDSDTDNAETDLLIEMDTPVSAEQIRVYCENTQTADQEKALGEFKVCLKTTIDGSELWLSELAVNNEQRAGNFYTSNGRLVSWREWSKFNATITISNIDQTDYQALRTMMKAATWQTIVLFNDFDLTDCYEVFFSGPLNYSIDRKANLYSVTLELKEI